jgi:hypothetical protein
MTKLLKLRRTIESMVQTILEEVNARHPHTMDELLGKNEFSNKKTITIAITDNVSEPLTVINPDIPAFELLRASLGFIFCERYGWTEETIDAMTLPEVFIALEHAIEYDAPSKKSVWDL